MRIDLYSVRRIRLVKISSPGEWVTLTELVARYNERYALSFLEDKLEKVAMHEGRLERVLLRLIAEGCYEHDPERGYRFLTSKPRTENR